MINGIIPDAMIDSRGAPVLDGHDPTKLNNTVTLAEIKGLGTINGEAVQQRAEMIERVIVRHAEALDAKYPGSKVLEEKNRYGAKGKFLALVAGSLPGKLLCGLSCPGGLRRGDQDHPRPRAASC